VQLTRRQFVGASAAALFPSIWIKRVDTKPVGWAILGLGYYATVEIMPNFAHTDAAKIVGLISGHPEKLARFGERYQVASGSRYLYDQMEAIASDPEIEVVYVITPPATHPAFAIRAAHSGKHVCSEKPMAPTPADCRRMIDACRKNRRLLQIGYRCHYEAHNLWAMDKLRSGKLGKIKQLSSDHGFSIPAGTWRTQKALAGGGSMMDIGIYSLNALRYLSGEEPVEVTASISSAKDDPRFADVEDTVDFSLKFPSGLEGKGTSGYSWVQGKNRYRVECEGGVIEADPATPYGGHRTTLNGQAVPISPNNQFAAQVEQFSKCVREGGAPKTPGVEGLRDIRIIEAIYRSGATGQPVRLS